MLALRHRPVRVSVAAARRGDLLVSVLCDGNLEPPPGGELRAREAGTVGAVEEHDGQRVARSQLLVRLANPDLDAQARAAQADLDRLSAERAAAAAEAARAEREAAWRAQVAAADRRLVAEKALPEASAAADQHAAEQAALDARKARADLAALDGGTPSRLELARRNAADLARRVASLTLRAPFPGVVYGLPRGLGETVAAGQLVATVTDPDHPHVRFRVDQPDLPRVAPGQQILVTFSGQPDRQRHGTVVSVGTGLREVGGRQVGEALGDLAEPAQGLPANAAVDVQVAIARRQGVLIVPRVALHRDGEERWVFTISDAAAQRRRVEVGAIGLAEVEIRRGLQAGEEVIVEAPVTLTEGTRVVARRP